MCNTHFTEIRCNIERFVNCAFNENHTTNGSRVSDPILTNIIKFRRLRRGRSSSFRRGCHAFHIGVRHRVRDDGTDHSHHSRHGILLFYQ